MKKRLVSSLLLITSLAAVAGEGHHTGTPRPDSHAPIGVIGDHMHRQGEWMLSYRFMHLRMEGLQQGSSSLPADKLPALGYRMAPLKMSADMHMIGAMYAPIDQVTLVGMMSYVEKDMEMRSVSGGMMPSGMSSTTRRINTSGWGDAAMGGLIRLKEAAAWNSQLGLMVGLPTAEVEHQSQGRPLAYGMQSGSGVWELRPSLTLTSLQEAWSCGAQVNGRLALEDENEAGFRLGDQFGTTIWTALPMHRSTSLSARLVYGHQDAVEAPKPRRPMTPGHDPANYGGDIVWIGAGINTIVPNGWMKGHRLALEILVPTYQNLNGVQLERDAMLTAGWQKSW